MNIQSHNAVTPLRQRLIEDMTARNLGRHSQRSHLSGCERFAAFLERSPDTATADDVRGFQLFLIENGASICNRNRIMTGVRFLWCCQTNANQSPNHLRLRRSGRQLPPFGHGS